MRKCGVDLGDCKECGLIHFTCPVCDAIHDRGYLNGFHAVFRCMGCGYTGFGHHPDPDIDAEVQMDLEAAYVWDLQHGITRGGTT